MLEHADRDDAVEALGDVAVVLQPELDAVGQLLLGGALGGDGELLLRQRDAGDVARRRSRRGRAPSPPQPQPMSSTRWPRLEQQLGGDVALLGELRLVERLIGRLEIGAGILPVGVEEERVEPAVEVVVMRDVAPRAAARIELLRPPAQDSACSHAAAPRRRTLGASGRGRCEQVRDRAVFDHQPAVHIGFAEPQLGIEQHAALGAARR